MINRKTYRNIQEIKAANKTIGHHFFDNDTLYYFASIIYDQVYYGTLFITSEQNIVNGVAYNKRQFSVRECINGHINTINKFHNNETMKDALIVLEAYAREKGYTNE